MLTEWGIRVRQHSPDFVVGTAIDSIVPPSIRGTVQILTGINGPRCLIGTRKSRDKKPQRGGINKLDITWREYATIDARPVVCVIPEVFLQSRTIKRRKSIGLDRSVPFDDTEHNHADFGIGHCGVGLLEAFGKPPFADLNSQTWVSPRFQAERMGSRSFLIASLLIVPPQGRGSWPSR